MLFRRLFLRQTREIIIMDPHSVQQQNFRNMKDFLQLYNKLTDQCFDRCVLDFNKKQISSDEAGCVNQCADRFIAYNQRLMFTFMEFQNAKQDAAIKEIEKAALSQKAEAAASQVVSPVPSSSASVTSPS